MYIVHIWSGVLTTLLLKVCAIRLSVTFFQFSPPFFCFLFCNVHVSMMQTILSCAYIFGQVFFPNLLVSYFSWLAGLFLFDFLQTLSGCSGLVIHFDHFSVVSSYLKLSVSSTFLQQHMNLTQFFLGAETPYLQSWSCIESRINESFKVRRFFFMFQSGLCRWLSALLAPKYNQPIQLLKRIFPFAALTRNFCRTTQMEEYNMWTYRNSLQKQGKSATGVCCNTC